MARPTPRTLHVLGKQRVTRNMLRITFGGAGMQAFPPDQPGAYIKLIFEGADGAPALMRTYTVRAQRAEEIDVDFVLHEDGGPASRWAEHCEIGDAILVGGPGPRKPMVSDADWHVVAGDMTALPAISANLEMLPQHARGVALLEVIDRADIQPLQVPPGFELIWLINPHPGSEPGLLADQMRQLDWPSGRVSVWAACEFAGMRALRQFLREERAIARGDLYISSYWKLGVNEDQHKQEKRADADQQDQRSA
ncbi:MAG: siderophore-interacting protein [Pseudomonadaceae bacterium]